MYFMHETSPELDRQLASLKDGSVNYEILYIVGSAQLAEILALTTPTIQCHTFFKYHFFSLESKQTNIILNIIKYHIL